jgi:tetratricopeptide (TPR) repeat protein
VHELITQDDRGRMVPVDRAALEREVAELQRSDSADVPVLRQLGIGLIVLGRYAEAIETLEQALLVATASGDVKRMIALHLNLGDAHRYAGRFAQAEPHNQTALRLAREHAAEQEHFALQHLGKLRLDQKRFAEARDYLLDALRQREAMHDDSLVESTRLALRLVDEDEAAAEEESAGPAR